MFIPDEHSDVKKGSNVHRNAGRAEEYTLCGMKQKEKQEVEIKLRVADPQAMARRLAAMGARKVRSVYEANTLFDSPRAALRKRGHLLRLRVELETTGKGVRALLTFKGPSLAEKKYKVRTEQEIEIRDPAALVLILAGIGLRPAFRYEKFRTTYKIPRLQTLHVELDESPAGDFIELEGPRRAIDRAARQLGFDPGDYITKSYLALHAEDCRRRGVPMRDMLFSGAKKSRIRALFS